MQVRSVTISAWRNLRDVNLCLEDNAPLVCLVGENGAGKSAVLEIIAAAAHHLGISQGVEMARGNPFDDDHDVQISAQIPTTGIDLPTHLLERIAANGGGVWNGQLTLESTRSGGVQTSLSVAAGGIDALALAQEAAQVVIGILRQRQETQHLYLDADRAYPPTQIEPHRYAELWQYDWASPEFTKQWAHRPTRTLYEEWMKYLLAREENASAQHVTAIRRARDAMQPEPSFVDPFDRYRTTLREVLPHLRFAGIQTTQPRTPLFDSAGTELPFSRLSGGEREIAFLVGQIDRFRLHRGLLLIDEPELHLNPDLLRNWLAFLRDSVSEGQVWIATHSLEAVEVAGPSSTFVFERDPQSRIVTAPSLLAGRPVFSVLAAAVGSPAFAISRLRFVYVEGDRQGRERERFFGVCGGSNDNRFLEGGSCHEVLRRLEYLTALAQETDEQLHIGGVVDRDFRSDSECSQLQADLPVHVLGCHEIENLFLQLDAVAVLLTRGGRDASQAAATVQNCADAFAGLWIVQKALASFAKDHSVPKGAQSALANMNWAEVQANWTSLGQASSNAVDAADRADFEALLNEAYANYQTDRATAEWYRRCLGKQTLGKLAAELGFKSSEPLERNIEGLWSKGDLAPPIDLIALRSYVNSLSI